MYIVSIQINLLNDLFQKKTFHMKHNETNKISLIIFPRIPLPQQLISSSKF